MPYWIQRADFRCEEYDASDAAEIQRAFRSRSWDAESRFEKQRQETGEETCSPGLGVVAADGRILHLCPSGSDMVVHYHFPETKKILGMFSSVRTRLVTADRKLAEADELISLFVDSNHKRLMAVLES